MPDLLRAALDVRARAYAPYSDFPVGCALRGARGGVYAGCNVENAAFPQGQCAEAGAIGAMVAAGERRIVEIAVAGGGDAPCTPCGGCRQRLAEFAAYDTPVVIGGPQGVLLRTTLGELLPHAFGPINLGSGGSAPASAVEVVRQRAPGCAPRLGIVLGSGLGGLVDELTDAVAIPYGELPGFVRSSVEGHAGRLVLGSLAGLPVACLQGRVHLYEGVPAASVNAPVRLLKALGCEALLLTNAAGALDPKLAPGGLVAITDHINMLGHNPLIGANDERIGPRFVDLSAVYDADLRRRLHAAAAACGVTLGEGVYLATIGPCFETPAEVRAFRALGADLVGMSTVPEAISARHCGLRVAALSVVTNMAAGIAEQPLSHDETLREARAAGERLRRVIAAFAQGMRA